MKYKGKKLKPKNYKVTYPKKPVKPGKYKIKVTLKGKYKGKKLKGSKTIEYSIAVPAVKGLSSHMIIWYRYLFRYFRPFGIIFFPAYFLIGTYAECLCRPIFINLNIVVAIISFYFLLC